MITIEQREELKRINQENYSDYQRKLKQEMLRYLQSVNTIKKGDIIRDHIGRIKVEECRLFSNGYDSCLTFAGVIINANGKENKKGEKRDVYQMNIRQ